MGLAQLNFCIAGLHAAVLALAVTVRQCLQAGCSGIHMGAAHNPLSLVHMPHEIQACRDTVCYHRLQDETVWMVSGSSLSCRSDCVWVCWMLVGAFDLGSRSLRALFVSQATSRCSFCASTKFSRFALQHCSSACADQPMYPQDKGLCSCRPIRPLWAAPWGKQGGTLPALVCKPCLG